MPDFREFLKSAVTDTLRTGNSQMFGHPHEVNIVRPDGMIRSLYQWVFPVKTVKGYRIGSVTSDITERRETENNLKKAAAEKEV